jgi:Uma2 family endonuclease
MVEHRTSTLTAEQFEVLACRLDTAELWDGHMVLREPAGWPSTAVNARLVALVGRYLMERGTGVFCGSSAGWVVNRNPDRVLAPDLAVIADAAAARLPRRGFPELTPDLVGEVRSPSDSWELVLQRGGLWIAHGAKVVWLIDPLERRAVEMRPEAAPVLHGDAAGAVLRADPVLPELVVPLEALFRGLV